MKQTVIEMRRRLEPIYGPGEAQAMIREIFRALKGWDTTEYSIRLAEDYQVSDYIKSKIEKILLRLEHHEPLQYILGTAHFYGLDLHVAPGVLIPRPETEELVQRIVADNPGSDLRVADLGTGSGAIAIALSRYLPFPQIQAIDISDAALQVARTNIRDLHCRGIELIKGDILNWQPQPDSYDIVVSNPPYIDQSERADMKPNVVDYEPPQALFVPDDDPLRYYKAIAPAALRALKPGAHLYFEINPRHTRELIDLLTATGFQDVNAWRDDQGLYRYIKATKPKSDD